MSGSWEIKAAQKVLVCILTREVTTTAWAFGLRNLQIPGSVLGLIGMPFDMARNVGCQRALESDADFLFYLDDDVVCPSDTIFRLMAHNQPIVSGVYYRRSPPIVPCFLKNYPDGRRWVTSFKVPDLIEVDYVGSGCLLIHRSVLERMQGGKRKCPSCRTEFPTEHRWFDWRVDRLDLSPEHRVSEDFAFCEEAQASGYKILVDTSLHCRHIGNAESRVGGGYQPLELIA